MPAPTDLAGARTQLIEDVEILRDYVQGPAAGVGSLIAVEGGNLKTLLRQQAEHDAAVLAGVLPFLPPVPWSTGLTAVAGPPATAVEHDGQSYWCNTPHVTGATFAADAAKWTLIAAKGEDGADGADGADGINGVSGVQGRLTLTSGAAVMTGNVTGATTIYLTPYLGNLVPIYDGSAFVAHAFAELSNATAESATGKAGPAAVANNSNYDLFVWDDAGTKRLTRGPAWSSATARGAGAGTTELEWLNGIPINKQAIANGPAAQRGTYVGSMRSDGSAQINWHLGGAAVGGTAAMLHVWNLYNRRPVKGYVQDTTATWTYNSSTVRQARAQANMQVNFLHGLAEDFFKATYTCSWQGDLGVMGTTGIGIDSTTAFSGQPGRQVMLNTAGVTNAPGSAVSQALGSHYMAALEVGNVSFTITFYCGPSGSNGPGQGGLEYSGWF